MKRGNGRPGGLNTVFQDQDVQTVNGEFPAIDNISENLGVANQSGGVFDREKPAKRLNRTEKGIRLERATALALAIRDAHPEDARQILAAALVDLSAELPSMAAFGSIREDAKWWAHGTSPEHLFALVEAALDRLRDRAMCLDLRKRLFFSLWKRFTKDERTSFLAYAQGGAQ